MQHSIFVFDPTIKDAQSRVRGIGRYLQILRENFEGEFTFTDKLPTTNYQLPTTFLNPFFNFLQKPLTLKRIAKKQIAVIHDLIPLKYPKHYPVGLKGTIYLTLNKLALRNYDLIITDSLASKQDIIEILGLPEKKIKVVYPCLPRIFTHQLPITNDQFPIANYCLYVGDATWNKNLVNLAKAIKKADVTCVFVGKVFESLRIEGRGSKVEFEDRSLNVENPTSNFHPQNLSSTFNPPPSKLSHSWQKELQEFFLLADGDKRFVFKGFVKDEELIPLYQNATANILPSRDEGFGFSYVEASNCGCPTLLADIPVLREISQNAALFTDPQDIDDMANKIKTMKEDVVLRKQIAQKAKERSNFFTQEQFKKSLEDILC